MTFSSRLGHRDLGVGDSVRSRITLAAIVLTAFMSPCAWAWGVEGHRLVAELAERQLNPKAAAEVQRLLAAEPGATMGSVASWADEHRTHLDGPWHYVNLPENAQCRYKAARDCRGGNCVVGAIEREAAVLASNAPDEERLRALKYLIHFVGDVHQPLHAGYGEDKGGNTYQIQAYGGGSNLHWLWDTGLITHWPGGERALKQDAGALASKVDLTGTPASWAEESCRIVASPGFYPPSRRLEDDYLKKANPVLPHRIAQAAGRLAALLNHEIGR